MAIDSDKHVPDKIVECVSHLQTTSQSKGRPDGGVSAIIFGIKQGKMILKAASESAAKGQKDTAHLQSLSEQIARVDEGLSMMENGELNFIKALDVCKSAVASYTESLSQSTTPASKATLSDSKKKISEYCLTICKLFVRRDVKTWFESSVTTYHATKQLSEKPDFRVNDLKACLHGKAMSKDAVALCSILCDLDKMVTELDHVVASAARKTLEASCAVTMVASLKKIQSIQWETLKLSGLLDEKMEVSFSDIVNIFKGIAKEAVASENSTVTSTLGNIMAKAFGCIAVGFDYNNTIVVLVVKQFVLIYESTINDHHIIFSIELEIKSAAQPTLSSLKPLYR